MTELQQQNAAKLNTWAEGLSQEQVYLFEHLPILHDMKAFLEYLGSNKVVGTKSTGNLPLKAVREICGKFTFPPPLEEKIGNRVFKVRSEEEVWPLLFIHIIAVQSGMITGGAAQAWQLTEEGKAFAQLSPPVQGFLLFIHWWTRVDWLMAFPFAGMGDELPAGFEEKARACLLELPLGQPAPYAPFADRLIAQGGLTWGGSLESENAKEYLHAGLQRMVIHPLALFGVLDSEFVTKNEGGYEVRSLASITLTPQGKSMLELAAK